MKTKMSRFKSYLIPISTFLYLVLCASNCSNNKDCPSGSHESINLVNNSSLTINWRHFIPDSVYTINGSTPAAELILQPNSSDLYGTRDCWEETFQDNFSMYFLMFNDDTVQAIGWQAISGTNRGLLKSVKVDLNYLVANNFIITYP